MLIIGLLCWISVVRLLIGVFWYRLLSWISNGSGLVNGWVGGFILYFVVV